MHLRGQSDIFFRHFTESDLIQAKDHLLTLLSGQLTEGQRSALCLLQQLCRIDGKKISLLSWILHLCHMKCRRTLSPDESMFSLSISIQYTIYVYKDMIDKSWFMLLLYITHTGSRESHEKNNNYGRIILQKMFFNKSRNNSPEKNHQ